MHLLVREYFNGALTILGIWFLALILNFLYQEWRTAHSFAEWRRAPGVPASIGIAVYMVGESIRAGWVWPLLKAFNDSGNQGVWYRAVTNQWHIALVAVALACCGLVCAIRELAPAGSGNVNAIAAVIACVSLLVASSFIILP